MKKSLKFFIKYSLFWLLYFVFIRVLFLLYNFEHTQNLPFTELILTFVNGIKLDISMMGYVLAVLLFLWVAIIFINENALKRVNRLFTLIFLVLFSSISFIDIELYRNWGFRIDSTILLYLKTPKESLASTPVWLFLSLLLACIVFIYLSYYLYKKLIEKQGVKNSSIKWYYPLVMLLLSGSMIIPIRGGFGIAPINPGTVFFSSFQFANHAALNGIWNFGNSLSTMNRKQSISFMSNNKADSLVDSLLTNNVNVKHKLIKEGLQPNILIIILESFNNGVVKSLGGLNAAPNLDAIAKEGVLFSNFYANGDRSDKGIVSILSGYPAQPTTSIIKHTLKSEKLPHLSKKLMEHNYSSGFYYGGEINFANMNSYFISGGYQQLVTLDDFSAAELNSKWGAHDHVVFERLFTDIENMESPFYRTMFTLSSHEPFDVPHVSTFKGSGEEQKYLNSIHYTDSCLGNFIAKAKNTTWWQNTLVVFVADHGSRWPGNISYSRVEKFKIPMVWTGGAIKKDTIISQALCQADIPLMLLNQLNITDSSFYFSKDVLSGANSFAFFTFNNGFGYLTDSSEFIWDNAASKSISDINNTPLIKNTGKAYMQYLLNDFNSK